MRATNHGQTGEGAFAGLRLENYVLRHIRLSMVCEIAIFALGEHNSRQIHWDWNFMGSFIREKIKI
jgi:hypothetical protein